MHPPIHLPLLLAGSMFCKAGPDTLPLCVFLSPKVQTRSSFLVTCKHSMCCPSLPVSPHIPLFTVFNTNRMERGNKESTSCTCSQYSTQWERKCLATVREPMECEGKIKWSLCLPLIFVSTFLILYLVCFIILSVGSRLACI